MIKFNSSKVEVKKAGRKGRGIFAKKKLRSGETIEIAPLIAVPVEECKQIGRTILSFYRFGEKNDITYTEIWYEWKYHYIIILKILILIMV